MREWSLHVLDLVENSLRAGARHIRVAVTDRPAEDRLEIAVDDDGPGLESPGLEGPGLDGPGVARSAPRDPAAASAGDLGWATDPFYTTKPGKRTGLGLSLTRFQAEQADGRLELARSDLGGLSARVVLKRSHVDRNPLGDLAATLSGVVASGEPDLVLEVLLASGERSATLSTAQLRSAGGPMAVALDLEEHVRRLLSDLSIDW